MSADDSANPAQNGSFPMKSRVCSLLLLGFCCWHAVFLISSIVPRKPAAGKSGNSALNFYRLFASGRQRWNMFETIPLLHSFDARIEVDSGQRGKVVLGSVLPGFAPYPQPELSRYYVMFYGMLENSASPSFFEAYLRRTDQLLRAQHGVTGDGQWALVVDAVWTRTLAHSRKDGVLYLPATRTFDAANPRGISP